MTAVEYKYIQKKKNKMHNTSKHYTDDDCLQLLIHALFSLIPVWFVMTILTVVINDRIHLPCHVFVMFISE